MATEKEILTINGREVTVSNPRKVYFPETGHTKLDLVNYYLAVAEGALRGAGGRPMALKRFVDGAAGQPFFQKRAPENVPEFIRTATLTFPSGRTADEIVIDDAAGLAWVDNLGCIDLNPHPVRAEDLDHPDELRVDLDPVPGVAWSQIREVALVARESLEAVGLVGWPKTSGSRGIHINVRIEPRWTFPEVRRAALALARDVERRAPDLATSKWWKEERHGVFLDYNQNAKDRTVACAYSVRPLPDARVSTPLTWDEVATVEAEAFTIDTVPARYAAIGDPGAGIDDAVGSLDALLELSARDEAEGLGDAPWPPNYAKQAGEPPRVQPSKARRPPSEYEPGRGEAGGPPPEVAAERAAAVAAGDTERRPPDRVGRFEADADRPAQDVDPGRRDRPGRVQGRGALEGLERWKARHPDIVEYLEPADILVDGMRGRSALWYRVRVNLIHVPEDEAARPGAARIRLRPVGGHGHRGVEGRHRRVRGRVARRRSRRRPNQRRRRPRRRRSRQSADDEGHEGRPKPKTPKPKTRSRSRDRGRRHRPRPAVDAARWRGRGAAVLRGDPRAPGDPEATRAGRPRRLLVRRRERGDPPCPGGRLPPAREGPSGSRHP